MLIKENIYILIFFEGPADGLGDTTITAEAKYSSKSALHWKQHILYAHSVKLYQFKTNDSEIKSYLLISADNHDLYDMIFMIIMIFWIFTNISLKNII